ncbi:MAG: hypothetical protein NWE78_04030 [Candidatus Bathyarchaeota archaeon]|nr:hypothetical protein [Candidatus Bathyarchaeota archaeon]
MRKLKAAKCPLCELDIKKEKIFHEDKSFITLRTENLKGHRERIMMICKEHKHSIPHKLYERGLDILSKISKEVFSYTPKAVIMDSTFATINDHWHLVVTDLDPRSEDFDQILATRWVTVVDNTIEDEATMVQ